MAVRAVIDIGTNSVKLLVMNTEGSIKEVLHDSCVITRLGEGVADAGIISDEAAERTLAVLRGMTKEIEVLQCREVVAVGTQALRSAKNSCDFIGRVAEQCGFRVSIIDGDEEARLSFCAAISSVAQTGLQDGALVIDVGGGSSEVILGDLEKISYRCSLPIGALSLYQKFFEQCDDGVVPDEVLCKAAAHAKLLLEESISIPEIKRGVLPCVGVGGTITTLVAVKQNLLDEFSDSRLQVADIEHQIKLYASCSSAGRLAIKGLQAGREDIILPGACIVKELLLLLGVTSLNVSVMGLRYGVMEAFVPRI